MSFYRKPQKSLIIHNITLYAFISETAMRSFKFKFKEKNGQDLSDYYWGQSLLNSTFELVILFELWMYLKNNFLQSLQTLQFSCSTICTFPFVIQNPGWDSQIKRKLEF